MYLRKAIIFSKNQKIGIYFFTILLMSGLLEEAGFSYLPLHFISYARMGAAPRENPTIHIMREWEHKSQIASSYY